MFTTAGVTASEIEMKAWLSSATGRISASSGACRSVPAYEPAVSSRPEAKSRPPRKAAAVTPMMRALARTGSSIPYPLYR
jgi:hypothetical protein